MGDFIFVYVTASSAEEAESLGYALIEESLAACVNILPPIKSLYRWEGNVEVATETILIAKTQKKLFDALKKRVKALHSYETPCIVALPVLAGEGDFLSWIEQNTQSLRRAPKKKTSQRGKK